MSSSNAAAQTGAYEAVARLLVRSLTVPQVFFEAPWPETRRYVDVMAIDRAGSGDLHVVEVKSSLEKVTISAIRQLLRVPAHYRWIAVGAVGRNKHSLHDLAAKLAESGIGLICIVETANGEVGATVLARPKRAESFDRTKIGEFLKSRVPDIDYGEAPRASRTEARLAPLPQEKIRVYLDEADRLHEQGHHRAAYLLAWSVTEAAMNQLLDARGEAPMRPPGALIREMQEIGRLTASEVDSLKNALSIRNLLVHGVDDPPDVAEAYRVVTAVARRLISGLVSAGPSQ